MKATGLLGDLHKLVNLKNETIVPRLQPMMDLVLAVTRGKKLTWYNNEPEVKLIRKQLGASHEIWNYLTLKPATIYCKEIEAKTIKAFKVNEKTIVLVEPRVALLPAGTKPEKIVFSLDTDESYGTTYFSTLTKNAGSNDWMLESLNKPNVPPMNNRPIFPYKHGSMGCSIEVAIKEALRKLSYSRDNVLLTASKKVVKYLGLDQPAPPVAPVAPVVANPAPITFTYTPTIPIITG